MDRARALIESTADARQAEGRDQHLLFRSELLSRAGEHDLARADLDQVDPDQPRADGAFSGRWHLQAALIAFRQGLSPDPHLSVATGLFVRQKSTLWLRVAQILRAVTDPHPTSMNRSLRSVLDTESVYASICADELATRLDELDKPVLAIVIRESELRPDRWRPVLRHVLGHGGGPEMAIAASILDLIGELEDIPRLRAFAHTSKAPAHAGLGRKLARRLAPTAHVQDLGHIVLKVGVREVDGSAIRRKVLSLVAFLLTRPAFAATRDQVLEALWPELEPAVASNSLNQTVYFLRRVFEEGYREDESANYIQHDGEVVRLDSELVRSQSAACALLIEDARSRLDPESVERLSSAYPGRFALDFEYDDWASPFRETLHAAYLDVIEQAVLADSEAGQYDRAGLLARRALAVDPDAEALELALLRIYKTAGSHSAAAEQYSHYASAAQDEGFDTAASETLWG